MPEKPKHALSRLPWIRWSVLLSLLLVAFSASSVVRFFFPDPAVTASQNLLESPHFRGFPVFAPQHSKAPPAHLRSKALPVETFVRALSADASLAHQKLDAIDRDWSDSSISLLIDLARFAGDERQKEILDLLVRKTGQSFGGNLEAWVQWSWQQNLAPHPDLARFKALLYEMVDRQFVDFFQKTDNALIGLHQIQWGSVRPDGIPPLKQPKMLAAKEADFLDDSDIVFGLKIKDDTRCYPKRILAWHEMFEDRIGDQEICGAY